MPLNFDNVTNEEAIKQHEQEIAGAQIAEDTGIGSKYIKLVQGGSKNTGEAAPGQFYKAGVGVLEQPLRAIPISGLRNREYHVESNPTKGRLCQSKDAVNGTPEVVGKGYGGPCIECPMSKENVHGKIPCTYSRVIEFYLPEYDALGVFTFSRQALATAKVIDARREASLESELLVPIDERLAQYGWGRFEVSLRSISKEGHGNTYYLPTIE